MTDRTAEFVAAAEVLRRHAAAAAASAAASAATAAAGPPPPAAACRVAARSPLYTTAGALAAGIKDAGARVDRLARLACHRGLFDDPGPEVDALTAGVKRALSGADGSLDAGLRAFLGDATRQRDGAGRAGGGGVAPASPSSPRAFWLAVGDTLKARLLGVASGYQAALRARGESMRAAAAQRAQYARSTWVPSAAALDSPLFAGAGAGGGAGGVAPPAAAPFLSAGPRPPGAGMAGQHPPPPPYAAIRPPQPFAAAAGSAAPWGSGVAGAASSVSNPSLHAAQAVSPAAGNKAVADGLRRRPGPAPPTFAGAGAGAGGSGGAGGHGSFGVSVAAAHGDSGTGGLAGGSGASAAVSAYAPRYPAGAYAYTAGQVAAYRSSTGRAEEMRRVEGSLAELGHMFTRLAGLVAEQGETLERIDGDVEAAHEAVTAAHGELLGFYASASGNRGFILRVFGVLVGVALLFAVMR